MFLCFSPFKDCCLPLCLVICYLAVATHADVVVLTQKANFTVNVFADLPANFGVVLPEDGLRGYLVSASPQNACEPILPPPKWGNYTGKWIALVRRFDCSFVDKVRAAQNASYDAVIIHNVGSNVLEPMAGDGDEIEIAAVFVGQDDGLMLFSHYQYDKGYSILLTNELPFNINSYLLPFAIVVAICFIVMMIFMIVKCVKDRRRLRRYRLPSSALKKIPWKKFVKSDPYDTCAICLEDFFEGEKLRILPCSHAYHCKCVDPWLTRNRRVCPVCKRRVLTLGEHFSDSESETEDETRPLLHQARNHTQGGTFTDSSPRLSVDNTERIEVNEEETVVQLEHSSYETIEGANTSDEEEVVPRDHRDPTHPDTDTGTPPNVETEDASIYYSPQNTISDGEVVNV